MQLLTWMRKKQINGDRLKNNVVSLIRKWVSQKAIVITVETICHHFIIKIEYLLNIIVADLVPGQNTEK